MYKKLLILIISTILISCKKDEIETQQIPVPNSSISLLNSAKGTISSYDNFDDGMNFTFTNNQPVPAIAGNWTLAGNSSNNRWGRLSWNWSACPLYASFDTVYASYLELKTPGNLEKKGAQVESLREDYYYGSYKSKIIAGQHSGNLSGTNPQGSVNGFFFYNAAEGEIDVEILSIEHQLKKVHFVTHPGGYEIIYTLPSDPTTSEIEYGFNWYVDKIDFLVNGVKVATQLNAIPNSPGKIIVNHWTGNKYWGGYPEPLPSVMKVNYIWHSPFISVKYPSTNGIVLLKGSIKSITWNRYGDVKLYPVTIELFSSGVFLQTIATNVSNTGSYSWNIPSNLVGSNFQIKIKSNLNSNYYDISNNDFTIQ